MISLDFETSVFKKEKVSLAGHDEVFTLFWIYFLIFSLNVNKILSILSWLRKIRFFFAVLFFRVVKRDAFYAVLCCYGYG